MDRRPIGYRGWVDETLALTEKGRLRHREIGELVVANRRRLTAGISAREYQSVLERMAGNLTTA